MLCCFKLSLKSFKKLILDAHCLRFITPVNVKLSMATVPKTVFQFPPQSLQNSSYNHFSAIYYLLLERVKEHRSQQISRQCGAWNQRSRTASDSSTPEVSVKVRPRSSTVCDEISAC